MTKNSIAYNPTLFLEDSLPVLRGLDSNSVDLSATDPQFNKGVRAFEGMMEAGENVEFNDAWRWGDAHTDWTASIFKDRPRLFNVIQYANDAAGDDMENLTLRDLRRARAVEGRMDAEWWEREKRR